MFRQGFAGTRVSFIMLRRASRKQGDGKHRLYNGASWRQAPGFPTPRQARRRGREDIHELASKMPGCRTDARHQLAPPASVSRSKSIILLSIISSIASNILI